MSAISIYRPEFLAPVQDIYRNHLKFHGNVASCSMTMVFKSPQTIKKEKISIQIPSPVLLPQSASNELQFNRPLPDEEELANVRKLEFDQFMVRKAVINEEIWTAAWLRAETHWEGQKAGRSDEVYKKNKYAQEEFKAIQNRSSGLYGSACTCVLAVMNEQMHTKTLSVIKSVVGTLDVSIRRLLHGETFPSEREFTHLCIVNRELLQKYAYVSNLCVRKSARGRGIATNMLKYAIDIARLADVEQLYVHVRRDNAPALALYEKFGFEEVEIATPTLLGKYLLCIDTQKVDLDVDIHT